MPNLTLGAYDRFNYGDLLFPIMLDASYARIKNRESASRLIHCTIGKGDMQREGGVETVGAQAAFQSGGQKLIVGGGEVLGAGWFSMWSSLQPDWMDSAVRFTRKGVPRRSREWFGRHMLRGYWEYPFVPDVRTIKTVGFNAIGATHSDILPIAEQRKLWEIVAKAAVATVRDNTSASIAARFGLDLPVVPDSAAAILDLPRFKRQREVAPVGGGSDSGPVVLQMSRSWASSCSQETIDALSQIGTQVGGLVLLPVGLASAHSDQSGLEMVSRRLKCASTLVIPKTLDEIVTCITSASVVIASSLHVSITAMAAGVRVIPLVGVKKLAAYVDTWGFENETPVSGAAILDMFGSDDSEACRRARVDRASSMSVAAQRATRMVIEKTYELLPDATV
ncbi:polysaccharide pyruvyl transferase family protein [Rhodococcus sp. BP22]|uniref:polysaccharide pyruvyl transferase family protein n=1 Tax=Rhodococcus sp. BP22 TaxID=2758566 RepID=UPI00164922A1|nr:polysaccharide pyruvyl transferase family protein [Rhodococcus sp. BP22]